MTSISGPAAQEGKWKKCWYEEEEDRFSEFSGASSSYTLDSGIGLEKRKSVKVVEKLKTCMETNLVASRQNDEDYDNLWMQRDTELRKTCRCEIDINFPETEKEQKSILTKIEEIVKNMIKSPIDLDFIRAKVMDLQ